jgi:hypothetical protein
MHHLVVLPILLRPAAHLLHDYQLSLRGQTGPFAMRLAYLPLDATGYSALSIPKTVFALRQDVLASKRLSRCPDGTFDVLP